MDLGGVADVGHHADGARNGGRGGLGRLPVQVHHRHPGAIRCQPGGQGGADATGPAGDHRHCAREVESGHADTLRAGQTVERDGQGGRHVERVNAGDHGYSDPLVGRRPGLGAEPSTFTASQEGDGARTPQRLERLESGRIEGDDRETSPRDATKSLRPGLEAGERHLEDMANRDPNGAPVKRIAAARVQQYRTRTEGGRVPKDGAQIFVVVDAFEDHDRVDAGQQRRGVRRRPPPRQGEHAAVNRKAGDPVEHLLSGHVHGGASACRGVDSIFQRTDAFGSQQQRQHRPVRGEQLSNAASAFHHEHTVGVVEAPPQLGITQTAVRRDPGIAGIADRNQRAP